MRKFCGDSQFSQSFGRYDGVLFFFWSQLYWKDTFQMLSDFSGMTPIGITMYWLKKWKIYFLWITTKISFQITIIKLANIGLLLRAILHKLPLFYLTYWCGNFAETLSFRRVLGNMIESFPFFWSQLYWKDHAQKMKFSIEDLFSKCDQISSFLRIWSHLPKKSLMENFIFCTVRNSNASPDTQLKLCVSRKFLHLYIRQN